MFVHKVKPGSNVKLEEINPDDTSGMKTTKKEAETIIANLTKELDAMQDLLYAEHKHKLLVVLQAMDTAGKDGIIRHVFEGVNPQGVHVAAFKVPSQEELDHDYLWRVHQQAPAKGEMVIFNRSHYEDVLVVRVHKLVPNSEWKKRYQQINEFEKMLVDEGTVILKFFLHISKDEQRKRLLDRIDQPEKNWKFSEADLKERELWGEYMGAYEDVLNKTSTRWAPWYVVPANKKWYRNLVVASVLVDTMKQLKMEYPKPVADLEKYKELIV